MKILYLKTFFLFNLFSFHSFAITFFVEPGYSLGLGNWKGDWETDTYDISAIGDARISQYYANFVFNRKSLLFGFKYGLQQYSSSFKTSLSDNREDFNTNANFQANFASLLFGFHRGNGEYSFFLSTSFSYQLATDEHFWRNQSLSTSQGNITELYFSMRLRKYIRPNFFYSISSNAGMKQDEFLVKSEAQSLFGLGVSFPIPLSK